MSEKIEEALTKDVDEIISLEKTVKAAEEALANNEQFQSFIKLQKEFNEKSAATWKQIESKMIENNVKSIKGDWGSLTIAERTGWDYDPTLLAPKFFKKVVDTSKLTTVFKLEGKEPKGATVKYSKYLMKRFK